MIVKIYSIFLGLFLGILITYILLIKINTYLKGTDSNDIKKKIYCFNEKCYRFTTEICFCPIA